MRLFRCRYNDPQMSVSDVYHSEKAWEMPVCKEIKGMLKTFGCTNVEIIPDSKIDRSQLNLRTIGSPVLGVSNVQSTADVNEQYRRLSVSKNPEYESYNLFSFIDGKQTFCKTSKNRDELQTLGEKWLSMKTLDAFMIVPEISA